MTQFPGPAWLNKQFGAPGKVVFRAGDNGQPVMVLANAAAAAEVSLLGACVLSYRPTGQPPVVFTGRAAASNPGAFIHGGIPVAWPWFGAHPDDPHLPVHGFARILPWRLLSAGHSMQECTAVLQLRDDAASWRYWPHPFVLTLEIIAGASLELRLATENPGSAPFTITQGFHSYFKVRDIGRATIRGLEDAPFYDKAAGREEPAAGAPLAVQGETNRVYFPAAAACLIEDAALQRRIRIEKSGSNSTVVWNPWREKSGRIAGLGDDGYRTLLCLETTNAGRDAVTIPPGGRHTLSATITSELIQDPHALS